MLIYVLKSGLCLLILFSFYRLCLENENFHRLKRFYLITALILSFSLPLISISYQVEVQNLANLNTYKEISYQTNSSKTAISGWQYSPYMLGLVYALGLLFFGFRFFNNLRSLLLQARNNEKVMEPGYIFILLGQRLHPFSFFRYIFLNKKEFKKERISQEVIEHEKAHVDQKHSVDLLFIELLQVVFWFNPIFIWIKRSMKLNHEFLADQTVISKRNNPLEYSNILYNYSSGHHYNTLSSPMSQSLIKKRIIMITKTFSMKKLLLRIGLLLPVLALCIYFFSNEIKAKPVLATSTSGLYLAEKSFQEPDLVSIKIEEDELYLDEKKIDLKEFRSQLDQKLAGFSDQRVKDMNLKMKIINPKESFLNKVNQEFSKTRLANLTGQSLLPAPPPMPPKPANAPMPPKAPKADKERKIEIEMIEEDGNKKIIKKEVRSEKGKLDMNKEIEYPENADYYLNDKKVSREEALKVLESAKEIQVDIKQTGDGKEVVRIYTE